MKLSRSGVIVSLAVVLISIISLVLWTLYKKPQGQWHTKTLVYSFALKNKSHDLVNQVAFGLRLPINITSNQRVKLKGKLIDDKESEYFKEIIEKIPPYGSKIVNVTLEIEKNTNQQSKIIELQDYLKSSSYIQVTDSHLQSLAKELKAESVSQTANNIYNWLINNVKSESYVPENKGALATLLSGSGDCTEFTYLFVALARANGIPARGVRGLFVPQASLVVGPMDYHDWAEFYDGNEWIIADSQKQIFDSDYSSYLMIFELNDSNINQSRFSVSDQRINVSFE